MSGAALGIREPGERYFGQSQAPLLWGFGLLATAQGGVDSLRKLVMSMALQGRLVMPDHDEESANLLLDRIREARKASGPRRSISIATPTAEQCRFALPVGWCWARLDQVANMRLGKMLDKAKNTGTSRPYLRNTNVQWHRFELDDIKNIHLEARELEEYRLVAGDLLVCEGGEPGRCAIWRNADLEMYFQKALHRVRPLGGVAPEFIQLCLTHDAAFGVLAAYFTGATIKHFAGQELSRYAIPLAPLAEQHRIVARVEELMKLCDALEQSGRLADEQHARLTSTLFDALAASDSAHALAENWQRIAEHFDLLLDRPEAIAALEQTILQLAVRGLLVPQDSRDALDDGAAVSLGDAGSIRNEADDVNPELPTSWSRVSLGSITRDLRYGTSAKCAYESVGAPVLRIPNLCSGRVLVSDLKFGVLSADEVRRLRLEVGDLLIIRSNGSASLVGSAAIVGKEAYGFAFAGYLMRLRLREEWATPSFVLLTLETAAVRSQIERPLRTTSGVKNINSTEVANIRLSLPPLAEQHRIVARVEELRLLCTQLRERLTAARRTQSQLADALVAEVLA